MAHFNDQEWAAINRLCEALHEAVQAKKKVVIDDQIVDSSYLDAKDRNDPGAIWYFDHEYTADELRDLVEGDDAEACGVIYFARDTHDSAAYENTLKILQEILDENGIKVDHPHVRRCVVCCTDANGEPTLLPVKVMATPLGYAAGDHLIKAAAAASDASYTVYQEPVVFDQASRQWLKLAQLFKWADVEVA